MVRALVDRLPVMVTARWVGTRTQPIAVEDAVECLLLAPDLDLPGSRVIEIGGPDRVSCGELMREYARQRGLRRVMIPVPALSPRLSSPSLGLVTPVRARVGRELVEGLRNETVVRDPSALTLFPIRPRGVRDAIARALVNEDRAFAATRWSDALSSGPAARSFGGAAVGSRLVDSRVARVPVPPRQGRPARGRPPRVRSRRLRRRHGPQGNRSELGNAQSSEASKHETLRARKRSVPKPRTTKRSELRARNAPYDLFSPIPSTITSTWALRASGSTMPEPTTMACRSGPVSRSARPSGSTSGRSCSSRAPRRRIATRRPRRGSKDALLELLREIGVGHALEQHRAEEAGLGAGHQQLAVVQQAGVQVVAGGPREFGRHGRAQIGDGGHHQLSPVGPPEVDRRLADARVIGDRRHRRALDPNLCGHRPRRVEDAPIRAGIARPATLALGGRGLARHLLIDGSTPFYARDEIRRRRLMS